MKTSAQRSEELRLRRSLTVVEEHIEALFLRLPMLSGFALRSDLEVADIAVHTWPGYTAGEEVLEELARALGELAEECPDAVELLRGCTFARAFH